jgi:hypothetical protein
VIRHVRPKLSCARCDRIVQRPAPTRSIALGLAGTGLLSHLLVSKYADHLPLYRQSEIYAREAVDLERSTLADWDGPTSVLLEPLVETLWRYVFAVHKLHADGTPVPVLPGKGKTKTGRLWTYVRDDRPAGDTIAPAVWFAYPPDARANIRSGHLRDFTGTLQADAYAGFNQLYETGRIAEAPWWARAPQVLRSGTGACFAGRQGSRRAHRPVVCHRERDPVRQPDERRQVCQTRARPLLQALQEWLESCLPRLSRKSDTTAAIRYALTLWEVLTRYCNDGNLEIDNNIVERALRPVALVRKNYLFAGSDSGGERAAAIYVRIGSAKLNRLGPLSLPARSARAHPDHPINRVRGAAAGGT